MLKLKNLFEIHKYWQYYSYIKVSRTLGRLTWLVYIIGAVIGGRVSFASTDEHDEMDGELVCRVLQLMNLTDLRLPHGGLDKFELAFMSFFEQFRKIYVGDQVQKTSRVSCCCWYWISLSSIYQQQLVSKYLLDLVGIHHVI